MAFRASPAASGLTGYSLLLEPDARTLTLLRHDADAEPRVLTRASLPTHDSFYVVEVLAVDDLLAVRIDGRTALLAQDDGPRWGRLHLDAVGVEAGATVVYRDLSLRRPPVPAGAAVAMVH